MSAIYRARPGAVAAADSGDLEYVPADPRARPAREATETLDDWGRQHRAKIEIALSDLGFTG